MEKNKKNPGWRYFLAEGCILLAGASGTALLGYVKKQAADRLLGNCVMVAVMLALTFFHYRREYMGQSLDYDNGEHLYRFPLCFAIGLAIAFVCGFLPLGGWPFLLVFCMLALFSNMNTGILAASSLLLVSVLVSGSGVEGFVLYFVCGTFTITLFRQLGTDFRIGVPVTLSVSCLLVCETANVVLTANARPDFELFVIPVSNMVISSILLIGALKLFFTAVVYRYRSVYLDINDTETAVLAAFKEKDRKAYMQCVHTTYFCERIAARLGMDVEAMKCAGYYYRLEEEQLLQVMDEKAFPPAAREILLDYQNRKQEIRKKETAVLFCADTIVSSVTYMLERGTQKQLDYDKLIDAVFHKLMEEGSFDRCDISMRELKTMIRIFKEEKLYYDFLR